MKNEKIKKETNIVSYSIKCISWLYLIISILFLLIDNFVINVDFGLPAIINIFYLMIIVILFVFIYAIGEIIQIIHDIRKRLYETTEVNKHIYPVIDKLDDTPIERIVNITPNNAINIPITTFNTVFMILNIFFNVSFFILQVFLHPF